MALDFLAVLSFANGFTGWIPVGGAFVRRHTVERHLELTISDKSHSYYLHHQGASYEATMNVTLTNHDTVRELHVDSISVQFKKRRLRLWRKTIYDFPASTWAPESAAQMVDGYRVNPLGKPMFHVEVAAHISQPTTLTKIIEEHLVIEMRGPVRMIQTRFHTLINQPDTSVINT